MIKYFQEIIKMDHFFQNIGFYNEKKKRKTTTQETKQKTKNGQRYFSKEDM